MVIQASEAHQETPSPNQRRAMRKITRATSQTATLDMKDTASYDVAQSITADSWDQWNSDRDQQLAQMGSKATMARAMGGNPDDPAWFVALGKDFGFQCPADAAAINGSGGQAFGEMAAEGHCVQRSAAWVQVFIGECGEEVLAVRVGAENAGEFVGLPVKETFCPLPRTSVNPEIPAQPLEPMFLWLSSA